MNQSDVIADAIEKGGGLKAVAEALAMSAEGVRIWRVRGKVPADRVVDFARITGVPREKLRPDLYAREHGQERRGLQQAGASHKRGQYQ